MLPNVLEHGLAKLEQFEETRGGIEVSEVSEKEMGKLCGKACSHAIIYTYEQLSSPEA